VTKNTLMLTYNQLMATKSIKDD